ncbi:MULTISPECIES: septal ring lytic transglycosylase RlpA family protein [unclassified Haematospirillum]|uniref:septal ring lytic transglycosylase RlpA family protein n=1 Tax=unclassified Haematospirillum TaxID=2622088 RepID=UPI00143B5C4B|nr:MULTISPECIES: septal ring lytic transglycosylase RlpA family protein [unclassified Haematospirillum]NKD54286.1 septal ring lytic transglycosylase RlpA family protein [Haematospirillum sp. H4890]NKD74330.1 septal ring lytic transglycosylase RlpA family protein [Haematospirillum sp. H4485]NKD86999.1 septal ring lytic transglycosylase RlpA family protein [Haematospirillum sp. 15-248]
MRFFVVRVFFLLMGASLVTGCAETRLATDFGKGQRVGAWKIGKPYQINGQWYYPAEDWSYRQEGVASWYGGEFGGRETANGEVFDPNALTAAHKTLPLPTLVRVTNLENGRALVVRINDRGPFVGDRLIDMSRRGAQLLGFKDAGMARVRVEILEKESRILKAKAIAGGGDSMPEVAAVPRPHVVKAELLDSPADTGHQLQRDVPPPVKPHGMVPVQDARKKPVPAEKPAKVAATGKTWVQVGAFSSRSSAESLRKRLGSVHSGEISSVKSKGRTMFRVRLGPFASQDEARKVLPRLKKLGVDKPRLLTE